MQSSLLGICTNFKERLGYKRRSVGGEAAVRLSTLFSNLVDQAKQGIRFTEGDWAKSRNTLLEGKTEPQQPRYKSDSCPGVRMFSHIIDHLKFAILIPIINRELGTLEKILTRGTGTSTTASTGEYSEWSLLKASVMFKKFYKQNMTWWIAGR
ncbi:RNA-dependent RNA polymerase [Apiospora arundinis]